MSQRTTLTALNEALAQIRERFAICDGIVLTAVPLGVPDRAGRTWTVNVNPPHLDSLFCLNVIWHQIDELRGQFYL